MSICPECCYPLTESELAYCPYCGKSISLLEWNPLPGQLLSLCNDKFFVLKVKNSGQTAVNILSVEHPKIKLSTRKAEKAIPADGQWHDIKLDVSALALDETGQFQIQTSLVSDDSSALYKYQVVPSPIWELSHAENPDGGPPNIYFPPDKQTGYIDTEKDEVEFVIKCSSPISLLCAPTLEGLPTPVKFEFQGVSESSGWYLFLFTLYNLQGLSAKNTFRGRLSLHLNQMAKEFSLSFKKHNFPKVVHSAEFMKHENLFQADPDDPRAGNTGLPELVLGSRFTKTIRLSITNEIKDTEAFIESITEKDEIIISESGGKLHCPRFIKPNYAGNDFEKALTKEINFEFDCTVNPESLAISDFEGCQSPYLVECHLNVHYSDAVSARPSTACLPISILLIAREGVLDVTMDFGTTNTCVAYVPVGEQLSTPLSFDSGIGIKNEQLPSIYRFLTFADRFNGQYTPGQEELSVGLGEWGFMTEADEFDTNRLHSMVWAFKSFLKNLLKNPSFILYSTTTGDTSGTRLDL